MVIFRTQKPLFRIGSRQTSHIRSKRSETSVRTLTPWKRMIEMASLVLAVSSPGNFNGIASFPSNKSLKTSPAISSFAENSVRRVSFSREAQSISLSRVRSTLQPSDDEEESKKLAAFSSPEDLGYLWKLLAGSTAAAVLIKYGSILVPEITRPSLTLALLMICLPVVMSVLLLIKASSKQIEGRDQDSV